MTTVATARGLCQCGCGQPAQIAPRTRKALGWVKGEPTHYAQGHRTYQGEGPNPSGVCMCGCGGQTSLASASSRKTGDVMGTPVRFISGHNQRLTSPPYVVDPDTGCWVWQRQLTHGYGYMRSAGRTRRAHIVYYERANGPVPDGLQLDHLCQNKACVNPAHLEAVTAAENTRRAKTTRLTRKDACEIRRLAAAGWSRAATAQKFAVCPSHISTIVSGSAWFDPECPLCAGYGRATVDSHGSITCPDCGGNS